MKTKVLIIFIISVKNFSTIAIISSMTIPPFPFSTQIHYTVQKTMTLVDGA